MNNFEDLKIGGITDERGIAQVAIPAALKANDALTLVALPEERFVAQFRTFMTSGFKALPTPETHSFTLSRGMEIGGAVKQYDGSPAPDVGLTLKTWSYAPPMPDAAHQNLDILYVSKHRGLQTDSDGRWTVSGAPRTLDHVSLMATDSDGNESRYDTAKYVETHRYYLTSPMDLGTILQNKGEIRLPRGNDISLQVSTPSGRFLEGAEVLEFTGLEKSLRSSARTDDRGRVHFRNRTPKELLYVIKHPDFAPYSATFSPRQNSPVHEITMTPQRPLTGRIVDDEGQPIEGATIMISKRLDTEVYTNDSVTSDAGGRFSFLNAPPRKAFYEILTPDYFPQVYEWSNDANDALGILSRQPGNQRRITGIVIDGLTGEPVKEFHYGFVPVAYQGFTPTANDGSSPQWVADAPDGTFTIPEPPYWHSHESLAEKTAIQSIVVGANGYATVISRRFSKHERNSQIVFRLPPLPGAKALEDSTVLHPDGSPAANVPIVITSEPPFSHPSISILPSGAFPRRPYGIEAKTQHTDTSGKFPRVALPPKLNSLTLLSRRASLTILADELAKPQGRFQLKPHGSIKGTLRMNGVVLTNRTVYLNTDRSHARVAVASGTTETDSHGAFQFDYVPYGQYQISLTHPEFRSGIITMAYQKDVKVRAGEVTNVAYHLEGSTVRGRIMSHPGMANVSWPRGHYTLKTQQSITQRMSRPLPSEYIRRSHYQEAQFHFARWQESVQNKPQYYLNVTGAGYFSIDAVPPGDYVLDLQVVEKRTQSDPRLLKVIGMINRRLTIPRGTREIDLGPITIPVKSPPSLPSQRVSKTANHRAVGEAPQSKARNIRFQVLDQSTKAPIEQATVKVREAWAQASPIKKEQEFSLTTDDKGTVMHPSVDLSAHQLRIQAWAPGYVAYEKLLFPQERAIPESMTIGLHRGRTLSGTVRDTNGKPVRDVLISLLFSAAPEASFLKQPIMLPKTGKDGRWSYDGIPAFVDYVDIEFRHRSLAFQAPDGPGLRSKSRQSGSKRSLRINPGTIRSQHPNHQEITATLFPGGQLRGQIIDQDLSPIPNATIRILGDSSPPTQSNQWGWFHFPGAFASPLSLQVVAKGFAPKIVELDPTSDLDPLSISLHPGQIIRFKVTNPSGTPLLKANVLMMNWNKTSLPLTEQGLTDAHGEFVWTSAPSDSVDFTFICDGYAVHHEKGLRPRQEPYHVTLKPTLVATFKVSNKHSAPVDRFAIYRGKPLRIPPEKSPAIRWNNHPSIGRSGSRTLTTFDAQYPGDTTVPETHIFRIEAFGYKPHITRIVDNNESPVEMNIVLEQEDGTTALLLTSEGHPVPNQHLTLSPPTETAHFLNGPIQPRKQESTMLKTNTSGHFLIPPFPPNTTLLAGAVEGFKILNIQPGHETAVITLEPWAQISGNLLSSNQPVRNQTIGIRFKPGSNPAASSIVLGFNARTDDKGAFQLEYVPAGTIEIIKLPKPGPIPSNPTVIHTLNVAPGSRLALEIDLKQE